jgi:hypothetical protein
MEKGGALMPTVRKLALEEVQVIENKGKGLRKLTEEEYDRFLADYEVGEYGEADLAGDEKRLTVRNRLKAAAGRRNVGIDFKRTQGNIIRFKIIEPGIIGKVKSAIAKVPALISSEPPPPPPPPAKKKGGRPRKTA